MTRKILIADDEPNIVVALEYLLRRGGYEVHVARDGDEALSQVNAKLPDLVLLDVMMPRRNGYEVCKAIRARAELQHTKVVMLSAKGRDAEINLGMAAGADLYITKPFSTRELLAKIKTLLSS